MAVSAAAVAKAAAMLLTNEKTRKGLGWILVAIFSPVILWFTRSAAQGNAYAQFFLDRFDQFRDPSVMLAATKLLHHMSRIFRDNSMPPRNPAGIRIDSKRRKRLTEKRMAMGHKADDHEEQVSYQQTM